MFKREQNKMCLVVKRSFNVYVYQSLKNVLAFKNAKTLEGIFAELFLILIGF